MKYQNANPEHTIGAEQGNRYAARVRRGLSSRRQNATPPPEPSRKPRDAAELLAKIDALYQELTLQPIATPRKLASIPQPDSTRSMGLTFIAILVVVLTAGEVWLYLDRDGVANRPVLSEPAAVVADSESNRAVAPVPSPLPLPATTVAAAEPPVAPTEMFETVNKARVAAHRKIERKRRAEEDAARQAAEAQERSRAEAARKAELAAAAALAAQPRRPASPEELCADRGNFFSRNTCEVRACAQAEWANHPSCVRRKQELDRLMSGGG